MQTDVHDLPDIANATGDLAHLPASARALAAASLSANTRRAYARAIARLETYLAGRALDDAQLAAYLAVLFDAGRSPAAASQVVAAVRLRAKLLGLPSPTAAATDRVLAGFRRAGRDRGRGQVAGVGWAQADAAASLAANDPDSLAGLRDAALLSLASDAMLRVSEVAALDVDDIVHAEDGTGRLTIRSSKTDQEGKGVVAFLGEPTLRRVLAWQQAAGVRQGALFRRVRRGNIPGPGRLSPRAIRTLIARRAAEAGVAGRVSGHSLRVGAAQSLAAAGASVVEMQVAGRWQSPAMPGRYARGELAARGAVARLRYGRA